MSEVESSPLLVNSSSTPKSPYGATINVVHLSLSFFLLFLAFNTCQSFETKVNKSLGTASLACLYVCFSVSNLFAAAIVKKIGERIALFIGGATYSVYLASNLYPEYYTLLPASALLGWGASILWTSQGVFIASNSTDETMTFNGGLFFAIFMANAVVGNLMAALFIKYGLSPHTLFIVLLVISGVAVFTFIFLRKAVYAKPKEPTNILQELSQVLALFKEPKMLILLPSLIYSGLSQGFWNSLPVTQNIEFEYLGYAMAVWGAADALGSIIFGRIADVVGRKVVMIIGHLAGLAGFAICWFLETDRLWTAFSMLVCMGITDAANNTQLFATLSVFQPKKLEAAFAFWKLIQSSMTGIAFVYSLFLNLHEIIILIGSVCALSLICFLICDLCVARTDAPKGGNNHKDT